MRPYFREPQCKICASHRNVHIQNVLEVGGANGLGIILQPLLKCPGKLSFVYMNIFRKKYRKEGNKRFQTPEEAVRGQREVDLTFCNCLSFSDLWECNTVTKKKKNTQKHLLDNSETFLSTVTLFEIEVAIRKKILKF